MSMRFKYSNVFKKLCGFHVQCGIMFKNIDNYGDKNEMFLHINSFYIIFISIKIKPNIKKKTRHFIYLQTNNK